MTPLDKTCLPRENVLIQIEDDPPPQKKKNFDKRKPPQK